MELAANVAVVWSRLYKPEKYSPVSSLPVIFITLIPLLHEGARNSRIVHAKYNVLELGDPYSPH